MPGLAPLLAACGIDEVTTGDGTDGPGDALHHIARGATAVIDLLGGPVHNGLADRRRDGSVIALSGTDSRFLAAPGSAQGRGRGAVRLGGAVRHGGAPRVRVRAERSHPTGYTTAGPGARSGNGCPARRGRGWHARPRRPAMTPPRGSVAPGLPGVGFAEHHHDIAGFEDRPPAGVG